MEECKGISYFCDHKQIGMEHLDLGLVVWPYEDGHFCIVRWGTELMVFNMNELMKSGELRKEDVLWFEEYAESDRAYGNFLTVYNKLNALLIQRPGAEKYCDIVFPHINGDLEKCEILQDKGLLRVLKKALETYFDGYLEGINEFFTHFFNKEEY